MPILTPYTLAFSSGPHLGTRGVNLEEAGSILPADTLFAALLHVWRRAGYDVEALAAPFVVQPPAPPFLITSAFPYAGDVRFYPMPVDHRGLFTPGADLAARGKELKRIQYLSEGLLLKALNRNTLDSDLFPAEAGQQMTSGVALQGGALWLLAAEVDRLPVGLRRAPTKLHALRGLNVFERSRVPRVTVDRVGSQSNIYHAGRANFAAGCGLWFGVQWRAPEMRPGASSPAYAEALAHGLALLQDEGIGGERSAGYGAFSLGQGAPVTLPDPAAGRPAWLLSRYHPRPDELPTALSTAGAAYQLTSVGGWMHSPSAVSQRRKRLLLLAEGSLICPPDYPAGDVQDVRPEYNGAPGVAHPVYRYGLALAAGWA